MVSFRSASQAPFRPLEKEAKDFDAEEEKEAFFKKLVFKCQENH